MKISNLLAMSAFAFAAMLSAQSEAQTAQLQKVSGACSKKTLKTPDGKESWSIRQCPTQDGVNMHFAFVDAGGQKYEAATYVDEDGSNLGDNYKLLAPATLMLEKPTERGGRAFLLHPIMRVGALSLLQFHYMTHDEGEGLTVKQTANTILATTPFERITFSVDARGMLNKVKTVVLIPY